MPPIRITADDRERHSGTVEALRGMNGIELRMARLPLGDYEVEGRILFERKTLVDLVASLKDGRLLRQACRLAAAPIPAVLILEGTARDLAGSGMRREAVQGALVHIALFLGIPLLRAKSPEESARLMRYAAQQRRAVRTAALPRSSPAGRPKGRRKMQLQILQSLPGVGPERAQHLLEAFGSVEAVFCAEVEALASVPGVGTGTARAIRRAVREPLGRYAAPNAAPAL